MFHLKGNFVCPTCSSRISRGCLGRFKTISSIYVNVKAKDSYETTVTINLHGIVSVKTWFFIRIPVSIVDLAFTKRTQTINYLPRPHPFLVSKNSRNRKKKEKNISDKICVGNWKTSNTAYCVCTLCCFRGSWQSNGTVGSFAQMYTRHCQQWPTKHTRSLLNNILHKRAAELSTLCVNFGKIWSACGQHEIQYTKRRMNKYRAAYI